MEHRNKFLRKRCYLNNLLKVARADGHIDQQEEQLLHKKANELGFDHEHVISMLAGGVSEAQLFPEKIGKRVQHLYGLVEMMMADGVIDQRELTICKDFARKMNLLPAAVDMLINDVKRRRQLMLK